MPRPDAKAPGRWPDVPACYGWLSLDRRGSWRLQGERVSHPGLLALLNTGYASDGDGNWLVHNGPQRVFVALEYTPWVLRLQANGATRTHTGADSGTIDAAYLDDEGNVLLHTALGIGLLDDRELTAFLATCRLVDDSPAPEDALLAVMGGASGVFWHGLPLQFIDRGEVAARFGYRPDPAPP